MMSVFQSPGKQTQILICTGCGVAGLLTAVDQERLACEACGSSYPVINGIPCFVGEELAAFSEVDEAARPGFIKAKRLAYSGDSPVSRMYNHYHRYAAGRRAEAGAAPLTLDIGVGIGEHYRFVTDAERTGGTYLGLDLDRFKLELFRERHPEVRLVQASAFRLPFAAGAFDVVQMLATLEHFQAGEIPGVLDEGLRVLKSGGMLITCYPAEGGVLLRTGQTLMHAYIRMRSGFDLDRELIHRHLSTAAEISRILDSRPDLEQVDSSPYPFGIRSVQLSLFLNRTYRKRRTPEP